MRPVPPLIIGFLLVLSCSAASAQMGPAQVMVAPVERRPVDITQPLVANVMPVTRTTVAAEQEGVVEARYFDEGQRVDKGDLLVKVNTDLLEIQLESAEAAKRTSEAQVAAAKLELENAQREVQRLTELFEQRVAPEKEYRDALTRRDVVAATITRWQASVAEKTAEVERLKIMLRKAQTNSPLSGVVARRHVEIGQWIEQGAAVADVLQLDPLHVEVNVPEGVIARVRVGDEARVEIDALGGKSFTGKIDQILPLADAASRTFRVKILLPNPDFGIWPGFFARAALTSTTQEPQFLVPRDAVMTAGTDSHVVVARNPVPTDRATMAKAALVPVKLGRADAGRLSVTGELQESDWVVTRGNESLRGGEDLIIMNPPPPPPTPAQQQQAQQAQAKSTTMTTATTQPVPAQEQ